MSKLLSKEFNILFLSKEDNPFAQRAANYVRAHFPSSLVHEGNRNEPLPASVIDWKGDLLISFVSSWILPAHLLTNATMAAINFHPGSPEYPGTGCTNFAVYEGATEYGVTVHKMNAAVDAGEIIMVKRFSIEQSDAVYEITQHCYQLLEESFYEIMQLIIKGDPLPHANEEWKRKPFTRKQLNALCEIKPEMSQQEMDRRIKATTYRDPWAFTKIGNRIFKLQA